MRGPNYTELPLLEEGEGGEGEEHKIVDSARPKHRQTTVEAVEGVPCTGWVHKLDVDKEVVEEDCMADATREPAREPLCAPTSAAVVLSVNYRKKKVVEVVDKGNNRNSELLQADDTYTVRQKTFWSRLGTNGGLSTNFWIIQV